MSTEYSFEFKRVQFPLKICFTMTINKSQKKSMNMAGINLRKDYFSHGNICCMSPVPELILPVILLF